MVFLNRVLKTLDTGRSDQEIEFLYQRAQHELERVLKAEKINLSVKRAAEVTHNMYKSM